MDAETIRRRLAGLSESLADLRVARLAVFGSVARGRATDESDLDFLVEFEGPATFDGYVGLKELLQEVFGKEIDLVTFNGIKPLLRDQILRRRYALRRERLYLEDIKGACEKVAAYIEGQNRKHS